MENKCKVCGRELVNDWEKEHGICAGCNYSTVSHPSQKKVKYTKRLKIAEIITIISGIVAIVAGVCCFGNAAIGSAIGVPAVIGGIFITCFSAVFGGIRELLIR